MIRAVVIDDENMIRTVLTETLNESADFEVVGEAGEVDEAVELIVRKVPDLVFLDIKLIGGTAFDVIDALRIKQFNIPPIIINTAFHQFEYATKLLNEYRSEVILILQKPFWEKWNTTKDEIVYRYEQTQQELVSSSDKLVVRSHRNTYLIRFEDLYLLEISRDKSLGKLKLHSTKTELVILKSLAQVLNELPEQFTQISRYTVINTHFISHYDHHKQEIYLHNHPKGISVGNAFKDKVQRIFS